LVGWLGIYLVSRSIGQLFGQSVSQSVSYQEA